MSEWGSAIERHAKVFDLYDVGPRFYHNKQHLISMYTWLESQNAPYSLATDDAILYHDAVYDEKPSKEYRSAGLYKAKEIALHDSVIKQVMATESHIVYSPEVAWIVRADVHALADTLSTIINYGLIMGESCAIYSIGPETFAKNSVVYMKTLRSRCIDNIRLDSQYAYFWKSVVQGINLTIKLSESVIGITEPQ